MNDSGEFQDTESNCSEKENLTFSVNGQSFQATEACHLIHGMCPKHRETFVAIHTHHRHLLKEFFTLRIQVPQVRFQCRNVQGNLSQEVKNELGVRLQCRCLKESRRPQILFCQWIFHRILSLRSKDCRYESSSSINSPHLYRFRVG